MLVIFMNDSYTIQDSSLLRTISKGRSCNGLYILTQENLIKSTAHVNKVSAQVWHQRLGHLSFQRLDTLKHRLDFKPHDVDKMPCCIFPLAKQHRLPFNYANNFSVSSFDLIHCDVWGPAIR